VLSVKCFSTTVIPNLMIFLWKQLPKNSIPYWFIANFLQFFMLNSCNTHCTSTSAGHVQLSYL
jgi:hypothetical protein